jgi:hypothetical protein
MKTIELLGNKDEVVLIETALSNLLDLIEDKGNPYGMAQPTADLLEQIQHIKMHWEDN